jgi:thioredoxin-like negative regulator of GroEL
VRHDQTQRAECAIDRIDRAEPFLSLLLRALKQAEADNLGKPGADKSAYGNGAENDLDAKTPTVPGSVHEREWVEPPSLLFGSNSLASPPQQAPDFRWPQRALVPLAALLATLIALGYGIYLYFALQPPTVVALPSATVTAPAAPVTAAVQPLIVDPAPAALPQPAALPKPASLAAPVKAPRTPERSSPVSSLPRAAPPPDKPAALPLFQPDTQMSLLNQAYAAYRRGELAEAQRLYTQAAARGPGMDALLGLAAIASVQNRDADAQRLYSEVLEIDPRNAAAQAALLDLLGNTDSQATESRLKTLIERNPMPQLHQTLGNLYAEQGRWHEAQAAYFEAWRGAPNNADYAFNLAVSLDQLQQFPAALTYYEKALAIDGVHRFDRAQAESRIRQLRPAP